ncbi:MAG: type II toxin-antitoxin system RelE/ParE family toxin [Acidobacteriota bacterium]
MQTGLHPEAAAELRAAALWYDERRAGLGNELVEEVRALMQRIAASPSSYATWPGLSRPASPIRRAWVERFPYAVAFEVQADRIFILAVAHAKRRPLYWLRRVGQGPAQQVPEPDGRQ